MRKISVVLLSIGALLGLSIYWQGPASADGMNPAPPEGFGKKIAAVSLCYGTVDDPNGVPLAWWGNTVHLEADGTGSISHTGAFNGNGDGFSAPTHVAWKKIGHRQIMVKHLAFNYAPPGGDVPAGTLASVSRNTGVIEFSSDFTEYWGTWIGEYFDPDIMLGEGFQGPVDPNTELDPMFTLEGRFWGTVLEVKPLP